MICRYDLSVHLYLMPFFNFCLCCSWHFEDLWRTWVVFLANLTGYLYLASSMETVIVKPLFSLLFTAWSAYSTIKDKEYQDGQFYWCVKCSESRAILLLLLQLAWVAGNSAWNQPPSPPVCLELSRHSIHICLVVNIFFVGHLILVASIQLCWGSVKTCIQYVNEWSGMGQPLL